MTRMRCRSSLLATMILGAMALSCERKIPGSISDVRWGLWRGRVNDSTLNINIALSSDSGLVVPRKDQAEQGSILVRFTISPAEVGERYRYMVYYRAESYKHPECIPNGMQHPLAQENFYGGFTDGFHVSPPATSHGLTVDDEVSIRCDPRNEFPTAPWGRNPRVGAYSLLVVAVPERSMRKHAIDRAVIDLRAKGPHGYIEPYWYWTCGPGSTHPGAIVKVVPDVVRLFMEVDLSLGVKGCSGDGGHLNSFIHHIDTSAHFENVPVIADMSMAGYTPAMFDSVLCFTPVDRLVHTTPSVPENPCTGLRYDTADACLRILNPAASPDRMRKENVGVRTRTALTYGRFRVHCELAPLLNDSDLWNGLTNAIWLIGTNAHGVTRRPCEGGYHAYGGDGDGPARRSTSVYAEIDFEIMKGMPWCPERAFPPIYPQQVADPNDRSAWRRVLPPEVRDQRGNVAVGCTNWDLACPDPPAFDQGCHDVMLDGRVFTAHRWDWDHRAVIQKSMEPDDVLFGPEGYWFEIDWRPDEIFWRIGPSPEEMRVVGYMNSSMTSVPDVPMWLVISQEFHSTRWWPGSPYDQAGIPFPAKDLIGRVFSITVD